MTDFSIRSKMPMASDRTSSSASSNPFLDRIAVDKVFDIQRQPQKVPLRPGEECHSDHLLDHLHTA